MNGESVQNGSTSTMIFHVRFIVAQISQRMALRPRAIITTGAPSGVGIQFKPLRFLTVGDKMEVEIEGLGRQIQ